MFTAVPSGLAKQLRLEERKVVLDSKTVSFQDMGVKRGGAAEAIEVMAELWQFAENREDAGSGLRASLRV